MLSWVLVAALELTSVQLQVGLRQEDRVGFIPLVTSINGVQSQSLGTARTISGELSPTATLRLLTGRSELKLSYTPQFLLTHAFGNTNTLTLHNGNLAASHRLTRYTSVFASGSATVGQIDFYRARRLLNPEQATIFTIPENRILSYASAQAFVGVSNQVGRFTRLDLTALTAHTGPAPGQQSFEYFRKQDTIGGSVRLTEQVTRRDSVALEAEYRKVVFQGGPYYNAITPLLIFNRRLDQLLTVDVRAGVQISGTQYGARQVPDWVVGEGVLPPRTGTDMRAIPVLGLAIGGIGVRGAGYSWQSRIAANLLPFYDPVQGVLQQRIAVGIGNAFILSRRYTAKLDFSVFIPGDFQFGHTNQPYIDQDMFAILNPVIQRKLTRTAAIEAGALITERFEDYTEVVGNWNRPEVILYLAFQGVSTVW